MTRAARSWPHCAIAKCALLLGLGSTSAVAAEGSEPPGRPMLEASARGGLRLPRVVAGYHDLPPGFGLAISGDVRMADYFAGGFLVEQVRFSFPAVDGGFLGYTLVGLLLRGYVLREGYVDPYLELALGGVTPIGIEHEGGLGYRAAAGVDFAVLPWLEIGVAGSYAAMDYLFSSMPRETNGMTPLPELLDSEWDGLKGAYGVDLVFTLVGGG
jgi:hypothetical protein